MPYLPEEVAIIDGLIGAYFTSPSVSGSVRESYLSVHRHIQLGQLTQTDYRRIFDAIDFLLPTLRDRPGDYRLMAGALAKTSTLLAAH